MDDSASHSVQNTAKKSNGIAVDERSPLLDATHASNSTNEQDNSQETKSFWYLILLTISIGGLQITWSVELSNGSPYLLSLGLSKSLMALVWVAGPLTGTLVQPYIGMLSDNCRLPWGKRKPFMIAGAAFTISSLLFLAWVKEIIGGFLGLCGVDERSATMKNSIIVAAVIAVYVLDFAINTVQAAIRAFMVDCAPAHQQEAANAMASRILGFGNIIGYMAGYVNLRRYLWFLGNTQFKILCVIASFALAITIGATTTCIQERDPRLDGPAKSHQRGIISFFETIFTSIRRLPPQVYRVCQVQFFAWVGFFPLLFYTSSYIGEIYSERYLQKNPHMAPDELNRLYEKATRIGTFALLVNSIVSLATNVLIPFFIAPTYDSRPVLAGSAVPESTTKRDNSMTRALEKLQIPGLTLRRAWLLSLLLFAACMLSTVIARSVHAATALIGVMGITWGMTLWAPWAIISAEISRRDAITRARKQRNLHAARDGHPGSASAGDEDTAEQEDQAGVILGIHNMAIAAPQMIATIGSSIIFKIWQKPRGEPGDHSMSIVFALGGVFVLISCIFVTRMRDGGEAEDTAAENGECVSGPSGCSASQA